MRYKLTTTVIVDLEDDFDETDVLDSIDETNYLLEKQDIGVYISIEGLKNRDVEKIEEL